MCILLGIENKIFNGEDLASKGLPLPQNRLTIEDKMRLAGAGREGWGKMG